MRGAAIDLGSNSFICLIFEITSSGEFKVLEDKLILTRLSQGIDKTKRICDEALYRSRKAFEEFSLLFEKYKPEKIQAVATSAARDALNKEVFLNLTNEFNIPVQILSGNEEAQLTFMGVQSYFEKQNGLIIDIGGGSTEYILVRDGKIKNRISLDMGVVRFTERYVGNLKFKKAEFELRAAIQRELELNKELDNFKSEDLSLFLAVSGTPTSAASILIKQYDPAKIEEFEIRKNDLDVLIEEYAYLTLDQRLAKFPYVESKRADVLPTGILILEGSLQYFGFDSYKVSTRGIRHGVAYTMFNEFN